MAVEVVKDIDLGYRKLMRELKRANDLTVAIGVQGKQAAASSYKNTNATNLQIAATHELGRPEANIPKRSFLLDTLEFKQNEYKSLTTVLLAKVVDSKGAYTARKALSLLGARVKSDARERIVRGIPPELAEATVRWRAGKNRRAGALVRRELKKGAKMIDLVGSFTPLKDTGTLIRSITWKVRKGLGGEGVSTGDEEGTEGAE